MFCAHCPEKRIYDSPGRATPERKALTLVEVVVSTLIVGVMTVAALNTLGAATRSGMSAGNRAIAMGLADELMAEILATRYGDLDGSTQLGPEAGENDPLDFDDVDDYADWSELPPLYREDIDEDGDLDPMQNRDDWRRHVIVQFVDPNEPTQVLADSDDQKTKRIHVIVEYQGQPLAEQIAIVTDTD